MGKSRVVREPINGELLRAEFKTRGVNLMDASAKIGYEESYLSKATRQGMMPKSTMLLIQAMYNIDPEIYRVKAVEAEPKEKVETSVVEVVQHTGLTEEDFQKLYKVVYTAVYEATKRALSE